jgi:hypothetical protein
LLTVEVWITGYAEGVQVAEVRLRVIHRGRDYLIGQVLSDDGEEGDRCVVISGVEFEWVRVFCPELWAARPPEYFGGAAVGCVSAYLDAVFGVGAGDDVMEGGR